MQGRFLRWCLVVGLVWLIGCPSKHASKQTGVYDAAVIAPAPASPEKVPLASITGTVTLAPKQRLPRYTASQFVGKPDAKQLELPKGCTPIRDADLSPVRQAKNGGLTPVLITVTGFKKAPASAPRTHLMGIEDCRIQPTLLAAMRGDTVAFTNRSPHAFLPQFRGDAFLQAVIKDQTRLVKLSTMGAQRLGCAFGALCGGAHVVVLGHPVYAVTDAQGKFRIDNVPANQKLMVHAWHPLFRETKLEVQLVEKQERRLDLTISPAQDGPKSKRPVPAAAQKRDQSI